MRIFAFVLFLVFVILPVSAAVGATHQIVKTVNGRAITFEAPPGMCAFVPGYPSDKDYLDYMTALNEPAYTLVLVFTVCSELENSQISSETQLRDYEIVLFPSSAIGQNDIFARKDFLREMKTFFDSNEKFLPDDIVE